MTANYLPTSLSAWLKGAGSSCLWLALWMLPLHLCAEPITEEHKLKAALIYKLSKFITWPDSQSSEDTENFNVCLLGDDRFIMALEALEGRKTKGRTVRVRQFFQSAAVDRRCRILFISKTKRAFLPSILQSFRGWPMLTLGDTAGFAQQGGMIQFTRKNNRVGFKINLTRARQADLKIAAPLLELSTLVDQTEQ